MRNNDKRSGYSVSVDKAGVISPGFRGSYRQGAEQLFDLFHGVVDVHALAPQEPSRLAFVRAGKSLNEALGKASERRGR